MWKHERILEATNVTIFKFIHWRPEFKISTRSFLDSFSIFSSFTAIFFRDSHKSSLGKRREEKTQHEIQIKSFQNFSPTQNTAGIQERCRCVFKMINGNEKLFFRRWHMCSYTHVFIFILYWWAGRNLSRRFRSRSYQNTRFQVPASASVQGD
jgi:hypothetical protein